MAKDVLDIIRARQAQILGTKDDTLPDHKPEMLLIGCVDARLDVHKDVGIPDGKALIYRNIAALVGGKEPDDSSEHISEAAMLEFAVDVMKVKHLVVMGHTDCGGIKACLQNNHTEQTQSIRKYLLPLTNTRQNVVAQGGDMGAQARAMEEAAVRQSITNLMTYPVVTRAIEEGRLDLHGWVINTATKAISELDHETGKFTLITSLPPSEAS